MQEKLLKTPLYKLHARLGAKMVAFAGYTMPVSYSMGVKKEHQHCRGKIGIFDVSHMGQFRIHGPDVAQALEKLIPIDLLGLSVGKQRYGVFTNPQGGILDDLMISNLDDHYFLVVNAANKIANLAHLKTNLPESVSVELLDDRALIAIQGPLAIDLLAHLNSDCRNMVFMETRFLNLAGFECLVSRSGYTGEDGFEISLAADQAIAFVEHCLTHQDAEMIGLGARDSLRLEAGLCLYGQDIDSETTPIEAQLTWLIQGVRRSHGVRAGGFMGSDKILHQIDTGVIAQMRVGLIGETKAPAREGCVLFNAQDQAIGRITSGTFSPTNTQAIAMGYVSPQYAEIGTEIFALVRGKKRPMRVSKMPFVTPHYYRGHSV